MNRSLKATFVTLLAGMASLASCGEVAAQGSAGVGTVASAPVTAQNQHAYFRTHIAEAKKYVAQCQAKGFNNLSKEELYLCDDASNAVHFQVYKPSAGVPWSSGGGKH